MSYLAQTLPSGAVIIKSLSVWTELRMLIRNSLYSPLIFTGHAGGHIQRQLSIRANTANQR